MKDWKKTKWISESGNVVTIQEVLGRLQNEPIVLLDIVSIRHLSRVVIDEFRKRKADLSVPIIVIEKDGEYQMILDGHHRLQKAIDKRHTHIYAKLFKEDLFSV